MVGIPRSTGCATCRRRKVKCDEDKPACQRCTRAGLHCGGYQKETVWRHTVTSATAPGSDSDQAWANGVLAMRPKTTGSAPKAYATKTPIPGELSLAAFADDFCFAFMFSNFVWKGYGNQWLSGAAEGKLGPLALASSQALAQSTFGRSKGVVDVERKGAVRYGYCLDMLARELNDLQSLAKSDASLLVVPILVLLMHASLLTDQTAACFHFVGMVELIRLAGPQAFQQQPLLNAMEAARATVVVASLLSRKKTFFADPAWITEPWALNPAQKPPQSHLLDILASVPGILQRVDTLSQLEVPTEATVLRVSLKHDIASLLTDLYCWRWRWEARHGHQVHGLSSDQTSTHLPGPQIRQHRVVFKNGNAAADIMQYNTVLVWLLALLWDVDPVFVNEGVEASARKAMDMVLSERNAGLLGRASKPLSQLMSFEPLRRPGSSVSVRDAAVEICRVYEWQSLCHGGTGEANMLYMWPLGIAMSILDEDAEGRAWIADLLGKDPLTRDYGGVSTSTSPWMTTDASDGPSSPSRMTGAERVQNFGNYLLREICDKQGDGESGGKIKNPGLVHLLLLRGRARQE